MSRVVFGRSAVCARFVALGRRRMLLVVAAGAWFACAACPASAQVINPTNLLRRPLTLSYDPVLDRFRAHSSMLNPTPRSAATVAPQRTRLNQFQYFGRTGTGGFYEALDNHQRSPQFAPQNYLYRSQRYAR